MLPDYLISDPRSSRRPALPVWRPGLWLALTLLVLLGLFWAVRRRETRRSALPITAEIPLVEAGIPPLRFTFPTVQTNLAATTSTEVYMPTASGRVISALYGSTRTSGASGNYLPRFHAGIDIAPTRRARDQKPLDDIMAIADGFVAYVQPVAGGSTYGRYIVLHHDDPAGTIYSLYAHLESIKSGIKSGVAVTAGQTLGRMGHSASYAIPVQRAHVHLEIGVYLNDRFADWLRGQGYPVTHGVGHGWNLQAIDPLRVLLERDADGSRSLLDVLRSEPTAFTLLLDLSERPDYFRRYADLWEVDAQPPLRVRLDVAEGGAPLRARAALPEDADAEGLPRVVFADPDVLGRNGRRLVVQRQGEWSLGDASRRWLSKLLF